MSYPVFDVGDRVFVSNPLPEHLDALGIAGRVIENVPIYGAPGHILALDQLVPIGAFKFYALELSEAPAEEPVRVEATDPLAVPNPPAYSRKTVELVSSYLEQLDEPVSPPESKPQTDAEPEPAPQLAGARPSRAEAISAAWTPERRAAQSKRISEQRASRKLASTAIEPKEPEVPAPEPEPEVVPALPAPPRVVASPTPVPDTPRKWAVNEGGLVARAPKEKELDLTRSGHVRQKGEPPRKVKMRPLQAGDRVMATRGTSHPFWKPSDCIYEGEIALVIEANSDSVHVIIEDAPERGMAPGGGWWLPLRAVERWEQ